MSPRCHPGEPLFSLLAPSQRLDLRYSIKAMTCDFTICNIEIFNHSNGQDSAAREALEWLRGTNRVDQVLIVVIKIMLLLSICKGFYLQEFLSKFGIIFDFNSALGPLCPAQHTYGFCVSPWCPYISVVLQSK